MGLALRGVWQLVQGEVPQYGLADGRIAAPTHQLAGTASKATRAELTEWPEARKKVGKGQLQGARYMVEGQVATLRRHQVVKSGVRAQMAKAKMMKVLHTPCPPRNAHHPLCCRRSGAHIKGANGAAGLWIGTRGGWWWPSGWLVGG